MVQFIPGFGAASCPDQHALDAALTEAKRLARTLRGARGVHIDKDAHGKIRIRLTCPDQDRGFSLIELLIVLAISALCAAFVVPMFHPRGDAALQRLANAERFFAAECPVPGYTTDPATLGLPATPGLVIEGIGQPVNACQRGITKPGADHSGPLYLHYRATLHGKTVSR